MTDQILFIDGDFASDMGDCKFHCSPTCHPAQVGTDWKYGCTHPAWPANQYHDFVPIVDCGGERKNCELKSLKKLTSNYLRGKRLSLKYCKEKQERLENEIKELQNLIK
jgi:hypothetical protein